ncbi:hypothetical protein TNCV_4721451 [Trichonephila clavipes]|uniref:Uncharacterized protein n=1 Tax=Trichonephila clavipes TaxID=2585209 RepID=A0A8X6W650_TRICX|nr:hypothetical protein TNCV_4721451 [Trichonephila clavipes]
MPNTSGYNLRPRDQREEDTLRRISSIQRKQRITVQLLRRGAIKVWQPEYQKQKRTTTTLPGEDRRSDSRRSQSLEVLVEDANYKT